MEIEITNVNNLDELIKKLTNKEEESIVLTNQGKPIINMTLCKKENLNRVGVIKDIKPTNISLEDFNAIASEDFGL